MGQTTKIALLTILTALLYIPAYMYGFVVLWAPLFCLGLCIAQRCIFEVVCRFSDVFWSDKIRPYGILTLFIVITLCASACVTGCFFLPYSFDFLKTNFVGLDALILELLEVKGGYSLLYIHSIYSMGIVLFAFLTVNLNDYISIAKRCVKITFSDENERVPHKEIVSHLYKLRLSELLSGLIVINSVGLTVMYLDPASLVSSHMSIDLISLFFFAVWGVFMFPLSIAFLFSTSKIGVLNGRY